MKNKTTALILSILVGGLGVDRFYLGYTGLGVLKLLTAGCFGILYIIDIIRIAIGSLGPADGSPYEEDAAKTANANVRTATASSSYDDLEKLSKLRDQGVLSDEEFAKMKSEILSRM